MWIVTTQTHDFGRYHKSRDIPLNKLSFEEEAKRGVKREQVKGDRFI